MMQPLIKTEVGIYNLALLCRFLLPKMAWVDSILLFHIRQKVFPSAIFNCFPDMCMDPVCLKLLSLNKAGLGVARRCLQR